MCKLIRYGFVILGIFPSFFIQSAMAVTPVDADGNSVGEFSQLQIQSAQNKLQLEILQTELSKLKVSEEIDQLEGIKSVNNADNLKLKLIQVTSFNGDYLALINLDGKRKNYHLGDHLNNLFELSAIDSNSVTVKNIKTNEQSQYFVA